MRLLLLLLLAPAAQAKEPPHHLLTRDAAAARSSRVSGLRYELSLRLDAAAPEYSGEETIAFELSDTKKPLDLDFFEGRVASATLNGRTLSPKYDGSVLTLPASSLQKGKNTLALAFSHPYSKNGNGLYRSKDPADGNVYAYTNFEPYDASAAFPCFDQPDLKAVFKLTVSAPADWTVVSNTAEQAVAAQPGGAKVWSFPDSPKMSTYLVAVAAGPWAVWTGKSGDIPLRLFARKSLAKYVEAKEWLDITDRGLKFYGGYFGVPYAFGKYDQVIVPDFNEGAMENIGAVMFTEDEVYRGAPTRRQRLSRADTILHEMAHQWFGDLVTMKWWDDLWLNESFATYLAHLALVPAGYPESWQAFFLMKPWAYRQDELVTTHPIEADARDTDIAFSNFDGITYGKGASSLKQIAYLLGDEAFRKGVGLYLKNHAYGNATRADFMGALAEASGQNLDRWTHDWLQTEGLNTLKAEVDCASGTITGFRLVQEAPPEHPTLRTHRTAVALYTRDAKGALQPSGSLPGVAYSGWVTQITELNGRACPDLVFPNAEDRDYVKVQLDARSVAAAKASLSTVKDALTRDLLWNSLWAMVLDAKLSASDYLDIALAHLDKEDDFPTANTVSGNLSGPVLRYLWNEDDAGKARERAAAARLETFYAGKLAKAPAGGDFQKLWFDAYTASARSAQALATVREHLDGKRTLAGFPLDQDRRWGIVALLRRFDAPDAPKLLDAERKRDETRRGGLSAIWAAVVAPDWEAKRGWLDRIVSTGTDVPLADLREAMGALFPYEQAGLERRWADAYWTSLKKLSATKDPFFLESFTSMLTPQTCRPEDSQAIAKFLDKNPKLPATPVKRLKNARQENDRCVRIRALLHS